MNENQTPLYIYQTLWGYSNLLEDMVMMKWNVKESERRLTGGQSLQDAGSTCYRLQGCSGYRPRRD